MPTTTGWGISGFSAFDSAGNVYLSNHYGVMAMSPTGAISSVEDVSDLLVVNGKVIVRKFSGNNSFFIELRNLGSNPIDLSGNLGNMVSIGDNIIALNYSNQQAVVFNTSTGITISLATKLSVSEVVAQKIVNAMQSTYSSSGGGTGIRASNDTYILNAELGSVGIEVYVLKVP